MGLIDLTIPALGEGIMEATVLKWLKQVGDKVVEEEPVLEIATDKVDSEVLSTVNGTIKELFFKENDIAPIGAVIAKIETSNDGAEENSSKETENNSPNSNQINLEKNINHSEIPYAPQEHTSFSANKKFSQNYLSEKNNNGFYSPLVLSMAKEEGISYEELANIPGTAKEGRLSKEDLLNYITNRQNNSSTPSKNISVETQQPFAFEKQQAIPNYGTNVQIVEMDRMRKIIAQNMKESQNTSATVTSFAEADVTNMFQWREKIKRDFEIREKTKITFTPMFVECIARTIKRFPLINSSIDGDKIIIKNDINIGMATALPSGNLIVPVIKNADALNIVGLTKAVNGFATSARNNHLKPSDTQSGTFTITNVGSFDSLTGTPIINQPQVAILAIGAIKKRPVVIETTHGDTIGIRQMMILSLSYDHRLVDGALGSTFLREVVKEIENWDINKKY